MYPKKCEAAAVASRDDADTDALSKVRFDELMKRAARMQEECDEAKGRFSELQANNATADEQESARKLMERKCETAAAAKAEVEVAKAKAANGALAAEASALQEGCDEARRSLQKLNSTNATEFQRHEAQELAEKMCREAAAGMDATTSIQGAIGNASAAKELAAFAALANRLQAACDTARTKVTHLKAQRAPEEQVSPAQDIANDKCADAAAATARLATKQREAAAAESVKDLAALKAKVDRLKEHCEVARTNLTALKEDQDSSPEVIASAEEKAKSICADAATAASQVSNHEHQNSTNNATQHGVISKQPKKSLAQHRVDVVCKAAKVARKAANAAVLAVAAVVDAASKAAAEAADENMAFLRAVQPEDPAAAAMLMTVAAREQSQKVADDATSVASAKADALAIQCARATKAAEASVALEREKKLESSCLGEQAKVASLRDQLATANISYRVILLTEMEVQQIHARAVCTYAAAAKPHATQHIGNNETLWCQDIPKYAAECWVRRDLCTDVKLGKLYRGQCPRTCGACNELLNNRTALNCTDDSEFAASCEAHKELCTDPEEGELYRQRCRKTCGLCEPSGSEQLASEEMHLSSEFDHAEKQFSKEVASKTQITRTEESDHQQVVRAMETMESAQEVVAADTQNTDDADARTKQARDAETMAVKAVTLASVQVKKVDRITEAAQKQLAEAKDDVELQEDREVKAANAVKLIKANEEATTAEESRATKTKADTAIEVADATAAAEKVQEQAAIETSKTKLVEEAVKDADEKEKIESDAAASAALSFASFSAAATAFSRFSRAASAFSASSFAIFAASAIFFSSASFAFVSLSSAAFFSSSAFFAAAAASSCFVAVSLASLAAASLAA